jgi:hypothetical protein
MDLAASLAHFAEHGWARVGPVLDEATCAALRERADDLMLGRVQYDGLFFQHDAPSGDYDDLTYGKGWVGPSLAYRKIEKLEKDPLFHSVITCTLYEQIARAVVEPRGVGIALYRAILMTKGEAGGSNLPWHQDGGQFWGVSKDPRLQIWTALDDAPIEAGCVEVVPGTHTRGLATPLGGVVPEDHVRAAGAEERALPLPARAGEAILIHNHVWHRSGRNHTGRPRRALSACYMSADTRCLRTRRAPREFVRLFTSVA